MNATVVITNTSDKPETGTHVGHMKLPGAPYCSSFEATNNSNVAIVLHYGGEVYTVEPGQTLEVKP